MKNERSGKRREQQSIVTPATTALEQETAQAQEELKRPATGLFMSGLLAGFASGINLLLIAILLTTAGDVFPHPVVRILKANLYSAGFIVVILGNLDLFTEYTTMAILPVLGGDASIGQLARLWGLVYVANVLAAALFAGLIVVLGPALDVIEPPAFGEIARRLTGHPGHVILLSGILTGWLMGLLAWLVSAGRETISQIIFVWLITATIGFSELHHSITGTAEVLSAVFANQGVTWSDFGHFLWWTTLGNIVGGVVFAVLIRYSVVIGARSTEQPQGLRETTEAETDYSSSAGRM